MGFAKPQRIIKLGQWEFKPWQFIVMTLMLILLVITMIWFFTHFERVKQTTYQLTKRASYNPYYAAELLIDQQFNQQFDDQQSADIKLEDAEANSTNQDEQSIDSPYVITLLDSDIKSLLEDLPNLEADDVINNEDNNTDEADPHPVLIIHSMPAKLSAERFMALQQWVEQGGHLITFTGSGIDEEAFIEAIAEGGSDTVKNSENAIGHGLNEPNSAINKLGELAVGNTFLAQLGIVAVTKTSECDDNTDLNSGCESDIGSDSDIDVDVDVDVDSDINSDETVKETSSDTPMTAEDLLNAAAALKTPNHLSVAVVPYYQSTTFSPPLLLKKRYTNDAINTDLFALKYPESVKSPLANINTNLSQPSYQTKVIRHYLQNRLKALNNTSKTIDNAIDNTQAIKTTKQANSEDVTLRPRIKQLLALNDDALLQQFIPFQEMYVDVPFGKGRISVLLDRETFTNPDPNIDIERTSNQTQWSTTASNNSPNESPNEFLTNNADYDFRNNLAYEDNAKLLIALTANASSVWILPNTDMESLPTMLWRNAKFAVLGLGLLLLIWLWSLYDRFGKAKKLPTLQSHDILRYFRQVGRFGWKNDGAITLLKLSRQQTRTKLYENFPKIMGEGLRHLGSGNLDVGLEDKKVVAGGFDTFDTLSWQNPHRQNPNANPLASLSSKDLERLSRSLVDYKQKKVNQEQANRTPLHPLLTHQTPNLLSTEHLNQALIQPLSPSYSTHEFVEITQTLWLLNWVLK